MRTQQEIEATLKVYKEIFEHIRADPEKMKTVALVMSSLQWVLGANNSIEQITPLIRSRLEGRNN